MTDGEEGAAPAEAAAPRPPSQLTHQQRKEMRKEAAQRQIELKRANRADQAARRRALVLEAASLTPVELAAHVKASNPAVGQPSNHSFQWPPPSFVHGAHRRDGVKTPPVFSEQSAYLHDQELTTFSLTLLADSAVVAHLAALTSLDLSQNELFELPGLEHLSGLSELNINRNWFRDLPPALPQLPSLTRLDAGRNFLRPNPQFLELLLQPPLPALRSLDLSFNKKLFTKKLADQLQAGLADVEVRMTVTHPAPLGARVGASAADRNAALLRSQLEPYKTILLRQRLEKTFGVLQDGDKLGDRAEVMRRLLECYAEAGVENQRKLVRAKGVPVSNQIIAALLVELRDWAHKSGTHERRHMTKQERPTIAAESYMILSRGGFQEMPARGRNGKYSASVRNKYMQNYKLWELAVEAMATVDPEFAATFTSLAVTHDFTGSPHIDSTNIGPFYGLGIGDYADGTGGVQVELNPMTVCEVNTKHRLGRIDGRFPHWVAPYDTTCERFSLIFYQTEGEPTEQTTAVFAPLECDDD